MARKTTASFASIQAGIVALTDKFDDMHHRLFGNGQPGEIDRLHNRISDNDKSVDGRLSALESWRWWLVGIWAGLTIIAAVFAFLFGVYLQIRK
jgi:hypothetical protein